MSGNLGHRARISFALLASLTATLLAFPAVGSASVPIVAAAPVADPLGTANVHDARNRAAAGDLAPLRAFVSANPNDRDATRLLGDYDVSAGNLTEAESLYRSLLAANLGDRATHDRLGRLYAKQDRIDDAIAQFEASLPDVAAYADLVSLHRRIGDLEAFVASYRDLAGRSTNDATAQFGYGVVLRRIHDPARALVYLWAAARIAPRSCAILDEVGNAQLDLDRTSDAIVSFDHCLSIDGRDYAANVDEAVARLDLDPSRARAQLDLAVSIRPNHPEAYVDLGYLEDAAGHPKEATAYYDEALSLDPFFRDAYVNLGYSYLENGRFQLAEETLLRGLGVSRDDGRIEYLLGETLQKQGKPDLAVRAYRTAALSDEPDVAAAARHVLATGL